MDIKLSQNIPVEDGYYLMKFDSVGGIHLVLIQTNLSGERTIIPETFTKKQIFIHINESHKDMLKNAYFSNEPIKVLV